MMESVKYWINEYHIDGFRFDLMGCHDIETMNQIRQMVNTIDPTIFIYGEGWSAGACALPNEKLGMKANIPQMPGFPVGWVVSIPPRLDSLRATRKWRV